MSGLVLPGKYRCQAFGCSSQKGSVSDFCAPHWGDIPEPLKTEWQRAREDAKRQRYVTGRMKSAHENVIRFLAEKDRADFQAAREALRAPKVEVETISEEEFKRREASGEGQLL